MAKLVVTRLAFAGDVHFAGRVARLGDLATTFGPITSVLKSADFTAVNLDTPVTRRGQPQPKTYHFATTSRAFTALWDAGMDLVTIANNHILDYGQTGLADTCGGDCGPFPCRGRGSQRGSGVGALRWRGSASAVRASAPAGRMRREQHLEPQKPTDRSRVIIRDGNFVAHAREGIVGDPP